MLFSCYQTHSPLPLCFPLVLLMPLQSQLTKRYEAIVRVCQWQAGDKQRARNVGGIIDKEKEIKAELRAEGAIA